MATNTTIEKFDLENSLSVVGSNGVLNSFSRDKLLFSVYDSLKHRKTAQTDSPAIVDTIISKVMLQNYGPSINIKDLQSVVLSTLQKFDTASAVHYKAYYIPN
jgi:transcriptional regulator NrdR family protein